MADVTVTQLAEIVGTPADRLLQQMQEAGLSHGTLDEIVTEEQKQTLLQHLKKSHGESEGAAKKITLKRRTLTTLKTGGAAGRGRTVNIEVRKKRIYMRRGLADQDPSVETITPSGRAEVNKVSEDEARRRAAHAQAAAEAETRRAEVASKAAEVRAAQEEKAKRLKANEAGEPKTPSFEQPEEETEHVSSRKDKRDRHDLDDGEVVEKAKKTRQEKKRKQDYVEELLDEEVVEILESEPLLNEVKESSSTLALSSGVRAKRPVNIVPIGTQHKFQAPTEQITREIEIGESITVSQLAQQMSVKGDEILKSLMNLEVVATINQSIDQETATLIVEEFGHQANLIDLDAVEKELKDNLVYEGEAEARAPVVTVMGHVDHGKTSLLDYIRKSHVAEGEAGGITQHIGAYRVETDQGTICFIDTPGHAAFTAMRARGANCTDIVILVVAADDGVMPQTEEAIAHAKAAQVPLVVAVNKIDKDGADIERVKNELSAREVIPEDWGGDTQFVPVSAITGQGVDELLEAVLLQAELLELTAMTSGPGQGVVIESELDKGKGPVATLLIKNGALKQGDVIVAGEQFGRIRALQDENNIVIKSAGPSTPVSVLGLDGPPAAGDGFMVAVNEKKAREVAEFRRDKANDARRVPVATSLDALFGSTASELNVVLKTDVRGTLEAITTAINAIGTDEVKVNVVFSGVGGITESDVDFARTSNAVVFGFNVRADNAAKKLVEGESIDLRYYNVIYDLLDDVKAALSGMLSPEVREEIVGIAEVRDVFRSKKLGQIAGCMVVEGIVSRNKKIRVLRDSVVIFEGELESLRHFKDEVEDIRIGTECGIGVKNYNDVKEGDQIEVFESREVARVL